MLAWFQNHPRDSDVPNHNYRGQSLAVIYQPTLGISDIPSSLHGTISKSNTQAKFSYVSLNILILSFSKSSGYFWTAVQHVLKYSNTNPDSDSYHFTAMLTIDLWFRTELVSTEYLKWPTILMSSASLWRGLKLQCRVMPHFLKGPVCIPPAPLLPYTERSNII
jgi:hypothetical protein